MITDALRYPVGDPVGRAALLRSSVCVVAVAVGLRYAAAFSPSVVALGPALVAVIATVVLSGTAAVVVGAADKRSQPPVRAVVRPGIEALALSVIFLAPPVALLARSLTTTPAALALEGGAGLFSLVSSTASLFFFVACAYTYPAAVATTASTGRLRAALEADTLLPVLTAPAYLLRWITGFSFVVLAVWLVGVSARRGDALGLIAAAATAYLLLASARVVGVGYARASGR
ncbi:hypothetical protein [Natrinema versiforme]|uniref:Uncharacterized protein n=1 Tax=Natrinema versiforme JCM 10478 TaxID=1227496 RepID=L9Y5J9_9EURY|nr:hypothetical protein [Natrinema versiforme]ELY69350.1 hypothetical protein C489_05333 [Natrinema versiforme JCM 10478]